MILIFFEGVTIKLVIYRSVLLMLHSLISDPSLRHEVFIVEHFSCLSQIWLVFRKGHCLTGNARLIKQFIRGCSPQICTLLIWLEKEVLV